MDKKNIQKQYINKIKELIEFNKHYYNHSNPKTEDYKYDQLKQEIINLEKKYSFLKNKNSPSKSVGYKPSKNFHKSLHRVPMLSLSNAFNEDDLVNFEKRIRNFISQKENFKISYSA